MPKCKKLTNFLLTGSMLKVEYQDVYSYEINVDCCGKKKTKKTHL